jgi:hypothetical protein
MFHKFQNIKSILSGEIGYAKLIDARNISQVAFGNVYIPQIKYALQI